MTSRRSVITARVLLHPKSRVMSDERIIYLLEKYFDGKATDEERNELTKIVDESAYKDLIVGSLEKMIERIENPAWSANRLDKMVQSVLSADKVMEAESELGESNKGLLIDGRSRFRWIRIAAAVAAVIVLGAGSYFMFSNRTIQQSGIAKTQEQRFNNDVDPGKYKAKLVLADGSTIDLDSAKIGELAKEGNSTVTNEQGKLIYNVSGPTLLGESGVRYNTLSTAKGETYTTVLADGSKVWLNSASSIKYPVEFVGNKRKVEITGEAYFEIKHNDKMPFIVSVNGMEVHDLGTEFNINAYTDETAIKTTLVSGSAKVFRSLADAGVDKGVVLKPGQQLQVHDNKEMKLVENADVDEAVAWKNGKFLFRSTDIKTLMRQLSRWYDVEVHYETIPSAGFNAKISRDIPLATILKALELTGEVKFSIEGKNINVIK